MEIIQERIRREYDVEIISTYQRHLSWKRLWRNDRGGQPHKFAGSSAIERILEPTIKATIHVPNDCIGDILNWLWINAEFATIPRRSITLAS